MAHSPLWIAQRHGQNWRDEEILATIDWMMRSLDLNAWRARLEAVRQKFHRGRQAWQRRDYFGSSRMIQLAAGSCVAEADHSIDGDWTPSSERPFHAHDVARLSVVSRLSSSREAACRKAKHFRSMIAKAARQLPGDRPGVVHVGYELVGGNGADARRDVANRLELLNFDVGESRLRYVYGNYMVPEHVTAANEAAALTETTATYQVGNGRTPNPLPFHLLFSEGAVFPGGYWLRSL